MRFLLSALLIAASPALAQSTCIPREYAQYKDEAKTRLGRHDVATAACIYEIRRETFTLNGQRRAADQCEAEVAKARDALAAAKDPKAVAFLQGGCKSDYLADTR